MRKLGITYFYDLKRSTLKPFNSQGLLDIMNMQHLEPMLSSLILDIVDYRLKRLIAL